MITYALYAMAAILLAAVILDLKTGKIPNWLTLLPFVVFAVVAVLTEDRSTLIAPVVQSLLVFVIGIVLFATVGFAAGAIKLMTGLALFVAPDERWWTLGVLLVGLFVSAGIVVIIRRSFGSETSGWHVLAKPVLPMSIPISLAGWAAIFILPL